MVAVKRSLVAIIFICLIATSSAFGSASNIYITQNGSPSGSCTSNVQTPAFFNNSANWGSGSSQIGPGTTVLLCGTFTFGAGATGFAVYGSGTSSAPIVIQFDTGAILQAPYFGLQGVPCGPVNSACGGAINVPNYNYIIVDGGTNGLIQNTQNGSPGNSCIGGKCSHQQNSTGVYISGSNILVRNLTIQNIYENAGSSSGATDTGGQGTADIRVDTGSSNITICNNTLNNARVGIWSDTSGSGAQNTNCSSNTLVSGVNYFLNTLTDHAWQFSLNGSGAPNVYANDVGTNVNWQFPTNAYHTDGLITFSDGTSIITPYVYNNYFHGDLGAGSPTGQIFCTYGGSGSGSACTLFNNVIVGIGYGSTQDALIYFHAADGNPLGPHVLYNNTLVSGSFAIDMDGDSTTQYYWQNNVWSPGASSGWFYHQETAAQPFSTLKNTNNNAYSSNNNGRWNWDSGIYTSLASWGSGCASGGAGGCDSASSYSNPNLSSTYQLQSGSPAIGLGANLTSLCKGQLAPLCYDKPLQVGAGGSLTSNLRPTSGAWDAGAYQYSTGNPAPAAPTGLSAVVQ